MKNTITYEIDGRLYLNITNFCSNSCTFCIRTKTQKLNQKYELWLESEPSAKDIIKAIGDPSEYPEIIFCGYGEPLSRLQVVLDVCKYIKQFNTKIRIDTNGQGNLLNQKNIVPELTGLVDSISISLNASDAQTYNKICVPDDPNQAFQAMLDFTIECKKNITEVIMTVVELPGIDIPSCQKIADDIGVPLRIRKYYQENYGGFEK